METKQKEISELSNKDSLKQVHTAQMQKKASGIDGVTKQDYEKNLDENLEELIKRMKTFSYRPQPVRRTYIPKGNGKMRPLGIPAYEDRLVQGVMANILNEVYEPRFLDCSYGFRPGRSAHDAIRDINQTLMCRRVNYILDCDIKGYFDNVNHEWLMKQESWKKAYIVKAVLALHKEGKFLQYWQMYICIMCWTCGLKRQSGQT